MSKPPVNHNWPCKQCGAPSEVIMQIHALGSSLTRAEEIITTMSAYLPDGHPLWDELSSERGITIQLSLT